MIREHFGSGMLTGLEIERRVQLGDIEISPFNKSQLNPNSYNLRLDKELKVYVSNGFTDMDFSNGIENAYPSILPHLDSHAENKTMNIEISEEGFELQPGVLYIGRTIERTKTNKFIPMINGRSSGGRLGLSVHICAGFGDIGFDGTWTLEITVVHPLKIYPGDEIAQVCFFTPYGDYDYQYNGRYQGQIDATPSKFFANKSDESLAEKFIEEKNMRDIANALKQKYGLQEFYNQGIDLNKSKITFDLEPDEIVDDDETIYKTYPIHRYVGKRYELDGGTMVYVRIV